MNIIALEVCILCSLLFGQVTPALNKQEFQNQAEESATRSGQLFQPCGAVADSELYKKQISASPTLPTWVPIMPARYAFLQQSLKGLRKTRIPLIADYGSGFAPAEHGDDAGLFYFVPYLANSLNLDLAKTIDLFLGGLLVLGFVAGAVAFFLILSGWQSKVAALIGLSLLFFVSLKSGDVYVVQSCVAIGLVPWFLYFFAKRNPGTASMVFAWCAGFLVGIANFVRSHSGTAVLIWVFCMIVFYIHSSRVWKIALAGLMFVGFLMPTLYFHQLVARRNSFLKQGSAQSIQITGTHVFWHSVYIGFGFVGNDLVPMYRDEVAAQKVASISPNARYLSSEYEGILRKEVFSLIRHHFSLALLVFAAKLGVIGVALILSANVGLLAAVLYPKVWPLEMAFWAAIVFSSLFALLVVPHPKYLLGFVAFGALYAIVSIDHALEARRTGVVALSPAIELRRLVCAE